MENIIVNEKYQNSVLRTENMSTVLLVSTKGAVGIKSYAGDEALAGLALDFPQATHGDMLKVAQRVLGQSNVNGNAIVPNVIYAVGFANSTNIDTDLTAIKNYPFYCVLLDIGINDLTLAVVDKVAVFCEQNKRVVGFDCVKHSTANDFSYCNAQTRLGTTKSPRILAMQNFSDDEGAKVGGWIGRTLMMGAGVTNYTNRNLALLSEDTIDETLRTAGEEFHINCYATRHGQLVTNTAMSMHDTMPFYTRVFVDKIVSEIKENIQLVLTNTERVTADDDGIDLIHAKVNQILGQNALAGLIARNSGQFVFNITKGGTIDNGTLKGMEVYFKTSGELGGVEITLRYE